MLSFPVTSERSSFLTTVSDSQLPAVLSLIRKNIQSCTAGDLTSTSQPTLDVAREHGRRILARAAVDVLVAMFPKEPTSRSTVLQKKQENADTFLPPPLLHRGLSDALGKLWNVLCTPASDGVERGASRIALDLLARAIDVAPESAAPLYLARLPACIDAAVRADGAGPDSAMEPAISALLSAFRRWPPDSERIVLNTLAAQAQQFQAEISECLREVAAIEGTTARKLARAKIRDLISKISVQSGVSRRREADVRAPPERLITVDDKNHCYPLCPT